MVFFFPNAQLDMKLVHSSTYFISSLPTPPSSLLSHLLFLLTSLLCRLSSPPCHPPLFVPDTPLFNLCTVSLWLSSLLQSLITVAIVQCLPVWKCVSRWGVERRSNTLITEGCVGGASYRQQSCNENR